MRDSLLKARCQCHWPHSGGRGSGRWCPRPDCRKSDSRLPRLLLGCRFQGLNLLLAGAHGCQDTGGWAFQPRGHWLLSRQSSSWWGSRCHCHQEVLPHTGIVRSLHQSLQGCGRSRSTMILLTMVAPRLNAFSEGTADCAHSWWNGDGYALHSSVPLQVALDLRLSWHSGAVAKTIWCMEVPATACQGRSRTGVYWRLFCDQLGRSSIHCASRRSARCSLSSAWRLPTALLHCRLPRTEDVDLHGLWERDPQCLFSSAPACVGEVEGSSRACWWCSFWPSRVLHPRSRHHLCLLRHWALPGTLALPHRSSWSLQAVLSSCSRCTAAGHRCRHSQRCCWWRPGSRWWRSRSQAQGALQTSHQLHHQVEVGVHDEVQEEWETIHQHPHASAPPHSWCQSSRLQVEVVQEVVESFLQQRSIEFCHRSHAHRLEDELTKSSAGFCLLRSARSSTLGGIWSASLHSHGCWSAGCSSWEHHVHRPSNSPLHLAVQRFQ